MNLARCVLWKSYFKKFREIPRKATVAELIFSISCHHWKFSGQLSAAASASMIFPWNVLNSGVARQFYLNGSESLTEK